MDVPFRTLPCKMKTGSVQFNGLQKPHSAKGLGTGIFVLVFFLVISCSEQDPKTSKAPWTSVNCSTITDGNADDCIRMNQIQVVGTHNSYKLAPLPELIEMGNEAIPGWAQDIDYGHRPIEYQLSQLNMRQLKLDIYADPEGGLYSEPMGALLVNDDKFLRRDEMMEPGFKVFHIQDADYRSTCLTFKICLEIIRDWSLSNPAHLPVIVLAEVRDRIVGDWGPFSFTNPIPVDKALLMEIDDEIRDVFEQSHIIKPDEIRGSYHSIEDAILTRGWPTLAQTRGRIMFVLDNGDPYREAYLSGAPNLEGRTMFVDSVPGENNAAFIKLEDAIFDIDVIREAVHRGYLVHTMSDFPVVEARFGNRYRMEHAFPSGAHVISTVFPEPAPFDSQYMVTLPNTEGPGRCNPVSAPAGCQHSYIRE